MPALARFLSALLTNRSSDLFVARLGAKLLLAKFGITGILADILSWVIRRLVGVFVDEGIYLIDVTLDSIKAAISIPEFKEMAKREYDAATKGDLTEDQKAKIRQQYLDTLDRFTQLSVSIEPDP